MISQKSFAQLVEDGEFTIDDITYTVIWVDEADESDDYAFASVSCKAANTSISGEINVPMQFYYSTGGVDYFINCTYIDDNAFENCEGITKIVFGDGVGVDGVGNNIFKGCTNLKTIVWNNTDPFYQGTIGTGTFDGCSSLDSIFIAPYITIYEGWTPALKCIIDNYTSWLDKVYVDIACNTKNPTYIKYGMLGSSSPENYQFVFKKEPLKVENYALMGDLGNTGTYAFLNNNEDLNNRTGHNFAMMAVPYDYSNNNWGSWITSASTATPSRGQSFLVYTTNKDRSTQEIVPANETDETIVMWNFDNFTDHDLFNNFCSDFSVTINNQETGTGAKWFALCNPYLCDLSLYKFYNQNSTKIQGTVAYVWDQEINDWGTIYGINSESCTEALYPSTGFMVAGVNGSTTFKFSPDQYTYNVVYQHSPSYAYWKSSSSDINQNITFAANSNGIEKKMYAKIEETSQNGFDNKDSYIMFSNNEDAVNPYFKIEGRDILDNRFNTLPATFDINFHSQKSNIIDFSLLNTEEDIEIALIDLDNNEETILNINEAIQINVSEGENEGRYQLRFSKKNVGINEVASEESSIQIFNTNSVINVSGKNLKNIEIYNTLGQVVYSKNLNTNSAALETNLNNGAYIVKVSDSKSSKTEKIIIR